MPSDSPPQLADRLVTDMPLEANAFALQTGAWKYDYEKLTLDEIIENVKWDARPRYCAETFSRFNEFDVLEFGPSDGYNTLGLELAGARSITSIEANVNAFLRCLILKNAFQMKAKFLLGDFLKYLDQLKKKTDLVYASGVLYHLVDPIEFLRKCGSISDNLFIWSFYYDAEVISTLDFERSCFTGETEERIFAGRKFTYHKRYYRPEIVADVKYSGGLLPHANWLTKDDLFAAIELAGYQVKQMYLDTHSKVPAYNILASKRS